MQTNHLKLSALKLAATHPADRRWLLARLPRPLRIRLRQYLKELTRIAGTDYRLYAEVCTAVEQSRTELSELSAQDIQIPSVIDLPKDDFTSVLQTLPPVWVAAALKVCPNGQPERYLDNCDDSRRAEIATALEGMGETLPVQLGDAIRMCIQAEMDALRENTGLEFRSLLNEEPELSTGVAA